MLQNKVVAGHKDCCEPVYETASAHPFPQDTNSKLVDSSAEVVLEELAVVQCACAPFSTPGATDADAHCQDGSSYVRLAASLVSSQFPPSSWFCPLNNTLSDDNLGHIVTHTSDMLANDLNHIQLPK